MGIFEKNLIMLALKFLIRWICSNEKNRINKTESKKKEEAVK
jgi:hypothetical protein